MSHSFAFTTRYLRRVREIRTPASIAQPFNITSAVPGKHPSFHTFDAIWDTGAVATVISQRVVDACGLAATGVTAVQTTLGTADCEVYLVNINLGNKVFFPSIHVTKARLSEGFDVLIGMDIIAGSDFAISCKGGELCFSFRHPSAGFIDFCA